MSHALIVEDDADAARMMAALVAQQSFTVATAHSVRDARRQLALQRPDVLLLDLQLPDGSGLDLFENRDLLANTEVVLITGHASLDTSIKALRYGVADYLTKPVSTRQLQGILSRVMRPSALQAEIGKLEEDWQRTGHFGHLWGRSTPMQRVYQQIARIAVTSISVFITGESGTGKEVVARSVHDLSRQSQPAFPGGQLRRHLAQPDRERDLRPREGQLHRRRAAQHQGFFERAHGGTLFLDEITEMPLELQVKLLRVLETGVVHAGRLDAPRASATCASSPPPTACPNWRWPKDRLREPTCCTGSTCSRSSCRRCANAADDVGLAGRSVPGLRVASARAASKRFTARRALQTLSAYRWPGNVRELRNVVQRAYVMADGEQITDEWLPRNSGVPIAPSRVSTVAEGIAPAPALDASVPCITLPLGISMAEAERRLILATFEHFNRQRERTAATLGVSTKTLYNRLKEYSQGSASPLDPNETAADLAGDNGDPAPSPSY